MRDRARELRDAGATNHEIAQALGVHYATVWTWLGASPHGRNRRLPFDQRRELRGRAAELEWEGQSIREISATLGVPRATVHDWLKELR